MSPTPFETQLSTYVDLALRIGLNLQPGQDLLVTGGGSGPAIRPFLRQLTKNAYKGGARYVDVLWSDDQLAAIRLQHASRESLTFYPQWRVDRSLAAIERGSALMSVLAGDPNLMAEQDVERVAIAGKAQAQAGKPVSDAVGRGATNWLGVAVPSPAWAALLFPDRPVEERIPALWQAIFSTMRMDRPDPLAAWEKHIAQLLARRSRLNERRYQALIFSGPGTDLTVGLAPGHQWCGGRETTTTGIPFTPNLPTEEVFTLPHREKVDGIVRASKPLSLRGVLIEEFTLTFRAGRVVDFSAASGGEVLGKILEMDEGAGRLGEVALVPHSSPISQSGLLFYNTLFDENAACHLALGRGYKSSLDGGTELSKEEFMAGGGNESLVHVDFMVGSGEIDVDGLTASGQREPLLRAGEWAFMG
jgi:aminopeptidase